MVIKLKDLIKAVDYFKYGTPSTHSDINISISMIEEHLELGVLQTVLSFSSEIPDYSNNSVTRTVEVFPKDEVKTPRVIEVTSKPLKD